MAHEMRIVHMQSLAGYRLARQVHRRPAHRHRLRLQARLKPQVVLYDFKTVTTF